MKKFVKSENIFPNMKELTQYADTHKLSGIKNVKKSKFKKLSERNAFLEQEVKLLTNAVQADRAMIGLEIDRVASYYLKESENMNRMITEVHAITNAILEKVPNEKKRNKNWWNFWVDKK
jgi:hypothetical protein